MRSTQKINFPDNEALCFFPGERSDLVRAITELQLNSGRPVIVLIGGGIDEKQADATRRAVQTIAEISEDMNAAVVCGGTDMGVMAEISQRRRQSNYKFPLIGVAPKELVAWPGGPRSTKFLWWGKQRWQLEPHYSHFILVPGGQFGDESPWIIDVASVLSEGYQSVTILINGGEVSQKDIELSLEKGRPVIALSGTGRLADEIAEQFRLNKLITVVPADARERIVEVVQAALLNQAQNVLHQSLKEQPQQAAA